MSNRCLNRRLVHLAAPPLWCHFLHPALHCQRTPLRRLSSAVLRTSSKLLLPSRAATRSTVTVLAVSHHLDGLLRQRPYGLIASHFRPWGSPCFGCVHHGRTIMGTPPHRRCPFSDFPSSAARTPCHHGSVPSWRCMLHTRSPSRPCSAAKSVPYLPVSRQSCPIRSWDSCVEHATRRQLFNVSAPRLGRHPKVPLLRTHGSIDM